MGEKGEAATFANGFDDPEWRFVGRKITYAGTTAVPGIPKQLVDVGGTLVWIEYGKDMDAEMDHQPA